MLPNVYEMDEYKKCIQNGNEYFKATVNLTPNTTENYIWKIIQERKNMSNMYYDRSTVYRWMCVPKEHASNPNSTTEYVYGELYKRFQNYGLVPHIENMYYFDYRKHENDFNMWTLLNIFCFFLYISFVIYATYSVHRAKQKDPNYRANEWIEAFSIEKNWKILTSPKTGGDAGKLLNFQTIRAIATVVVMGNHISFVNGHLYTSDFEVFEKLFHSDIMVFFLSTAFFVVQPFFLMSSFLLTNQICDIYSTNGKLTLWDCWCLLINRFFRFWPTLFLLWWIVTKNNVFPYVPQLAEIGDTVAEECVQYSYAFLFFYNNFLIFKHTCHPGTWYISADTQLYVATVLIFYVILKMKLNMKKSLWNLFIFSIFAHVVLRYYYKLDVAPPLGPKTCIRTQFLFDTSYILHYTAPTSIWTTTLMGALFGHFFYHHKNEKISLKNSIQWIITATSFLLLVGPLVFVVFIRNRPLSNPLIIYVVGAIIKPLFALGSGILMLGAAFRVLPKKVQKLLEIKTLVVMGNFTFGFYLCHFFPAFLRGGFTDGLYRFDVIDIIFHAMLVFIFGVLMAIFLALFVEQPCINLQKKILPQIKKSGGKKQL